MKRLSAAVLMGLFIISYLWFGHTYIKKTLNKGEKMLQECVTAYEKQEDANRKVNQLKDYWKGKEGSLSVFANHDVIDQAEAAITALPSLSNGEKNPVFYETVENVRDAFYRIWEDNSLNMHTFF